MLTELSIRTLTSREIGDKIIYDTALPGFGVRITQNGVKSFILTHGRQRKRLTIGRVGVVSLQEARGEAKRLLAEFTLGKTLPKSISWITARDEFLATVQGKRRAKTHDNYKRALAYFRFGETKLCDLTPADIEKVLKGLSDRPTTQFVSYGIIRTFFKWAYRRHYTDQNPMDRVDPPNRYKDRSRVLTDEELVKVWRACGDDTYGRLVRFLILTGSRRGEPEHLRISSGIAKLPPEHAKNSRDHTIPITALSQSLLPLGRWRGWSKSKVALDKRSGVTGWTLHDLRRTFASGLQKLGVRLEVIEALLNHVSGSKAGIVGVYQRYDYAKEKCDAIELWEQHVLNLLATG